MTISITALRALLAAGTPGPWRALRDGNQYVNTNYLPTAKLVGASRLEGPARPWNPHAYVARGFAPTEFETVRFTDEDADLVTAAVNALPELLDEVARLLEVNKAIRAERDALFEASMKLHHEERPVRIELRMAKVEIARLRALVEEACEIGMRVVGDAQVLPSTDGDRLAAIRDEANGAK